MSTHYQNAVRSLETATSRATPSYLPIEVGLAWAQVEATLALAEAQQTANQIALAQVSLGLAGVDSITISLYDTLNARVFQ